MGGSGGGGRDLNRSELSALEQAARKALRESDQPVTRNVFISFASEDLDEVNLLRGQAKNDNSHLEFNDRSLQEPFDSNNADYIKRGIREKINQASVAICYLSTSSAKSHWVDWEIRECIKMGKQVIAVHKGDKPPNQIPKSIGEFNIKIIPWDQKRISTEIEKAAKNR